MFVAYVHARHEPPGDQPDRDPGSSRSGGGDDPFGIVLAVWLWAIMALMIAGLFVSWL